jgi:5'-3' exonuclease
MFKPTQKVVMCFDRSSWRKEYTADKPFLKPYKGNRRQDMTPAQKAKYERFCNHLKEFESLIINHTTIATLYGERLEADDLIAGFVQRECDNNIVIITADSDMAQLLKYDNVDVISPITDKRQASLDKFDGDPLYYLFHKCIRGDASDNVAAAYPRVRSTKIKEVYDDAMTGDGYKYINFMNQTWTDQNKQEFTVAEMFKHNQILIDLEYQPADIKSAIESVITAEHHRERQFSYFHILKFIGKYKLKKLADNIDNFIPMLSK